MRRKVALAALAVLTVSGCGSTVQSQGTASLGSDDGLAAPPAGGAGASPGARPGSLPGGSAPRTGGTGTGTGGTATGLPGGGPVGGSGGLPASGRGYDARHVYIGFPTNNDVNQAANNLGFGALNFGDQPAMINAVVKDINHHGGVLGRTVVPVMHDLKTSQLNTDPPTAASQTCSAFTEDRSVIAVVNVVAGIDLQTFYRCMAQHDTPVFTAGFVPIDDEFMAGYAPYLYKLIPASFTELSPVWIDRLAALRYFSGWNAATGAPGKAPARIGLLYPSQQPEQRIFADLKARLSARGYTVAKEAQYDPSSLEREGATMGNAVLPFRNAGVTHVLSAGSDVLLFMQAAENQHYRPRYGLNSYHAPAAALQPIVPAAQLVGSVGVGWLPLGDVDAQHNPGVVGPGEAACRKIMRNAGVDIADSGAAIIAMALCDGVGLIGKGTAASGSPTAQGLRYGVSRVGPAFASALVWRSALSPSRADLPGAARDFVFASGAYRYASRTKYRI